MKIAVIGMACRYPGANSPDELYENVLSGRRAFRQVPEERWNHSGYYHKDKKNSDTTYCKKAAVIEGFTFDPVEYRIPKSTYEATDIAQWMALQVAKEAIEDAELDLSKNKTTGVIIGNTLTGEISRAMVLRYRWPYVSKIIKELLDNFGLARKEQEYILNKVEQRYKAPFPVVNEDNLAGGLSNTIAGRICNYFDLKGGGFTTDGACSSSLLAINQACIALADGTCDFALAGGVDISLDPFELVGFAKVGALSDSDIRVYDQFSNGFLPGEGCGIVVLQRYDEAVEQNKNIYAVIHGIGISSDGKGGITAPNVEGQSLAVQRAYEMAGYDFSDVELIEGHGTGTPIGDKVELSNFIQAKALSNPNEPHRCAIGSIKSNIGHTKAAAGVAGFIKAVMSVCYGIMPSSQAISKPNHLFKETEHLYPLLNGKLWPEGKDSLRRAAVSSAGFGGINTHITISSSEQNPKQNLDKQDHYQHLLATPQSSEVILIGASSLGELRELVYKYINIASRISMAELTDFACFLSKKMMASRLRLSLVVNNPEQMLSKLNIVREYLEGIVNEHDVNYINKKDSIFILANFKHIRIAYLFPGQASQYPNMGKYFIQRNKIFSDTFNQCESILDDELPQKLGDYIYADMDLFNGDQLENFKNNLNETSITQPSVTAISISCLHFLRELGVRADLAIGHSLGEYAALYSAGAITIEELLKLVSARGVAMSSSSSLDGAMLSINASQKDVVNLIESVEIDEYQELVVSNINSPSQIIVSGTIDAIHSLQKLTENKGINSTLLPVSTAFHSKLMKSAADIMSSHLSSIKFNPLRHLIISPATADFVSSPTSLHQILKDQITLPVNFVGALDTALKEDIDLFIEVGPGNVLSGLMKSILPDDSDVLVTPIDTGERGQHSEGLNQMIAFLYACGNSLNYNLLFEGRFVRDFSDNYEPNFIASPCEIAIDPLDLGIELGRDNQLHIDSNLLTSSTNDEYVEKVQMVSGPDAVFGLLKAQIAKDFGYPEEMISESSSLEEDLGLDSLKSVEVILEVMGDLGVKADVTELRSKNLKEIAGFVHSLSEDSSQSNNLPEIEFPLGDWVRPFMPIMTVEALLPEIDRDALSYDSVVIAYEEETQLTKSLCDELKQLTSSVHYMKIGTDKLPQAKFNACFYFVNNSKDLDEWILNQEGFDKKHYYRPKALLELSQNLINSSRTGDGFFALIASDGAQFWSQGTATFLEAGPGYIKTLHLESPNINTRNIEIHKNLSIQKSIEKVLLEYCSKNNHEDIFLSSDGERSIVQYEPVTLEQLGESKQALNDGDVILVTGGAKGITAECVKALAQRSNYRFALVGSSSYDVSNVDNEIGLTLSCLKKLGVECDYFSCDISDYENTKLLINEIAEKLGPIKSVLHAAGVNNLQKIATADWDSYLRVLQIKMKGLSNLLSVIDLDEVKSINIFSSVIANSGMSGNGEYAYANEWMNQLIERIKHQYPNISCRSYGYSVWADVGMGTRHNSTDLLASMGISAIPVSKGTEVFVDLFGKEWINSNFIISSRMGDLGTIQFSEHRIEHSRFTENVLYSQPGIELVTEVKLDPEVDHFIKDHIYEGSMLFPAVMGIEAISQVANACRINADPTLSLNFHLENLKFERAITVSEKESSIRIYAQMHQSKIPNEQKATVSIRSSSTNFSLDYFSANVVWSNEHLSEVAPQYEKSHYLQLDPKKDLYGKILFQGEIFQNIIGYRELSSVHCIADIAIPKKIDIFSEDKFNSEIIYGSGQVRDSFLHAVQLCVPEYKILPVSMERVEYRGYQLSPSDVMLTMHAVERERTEKGFVYDLHIFSEQGVCVEKIIGFKCHIMNDYTDADNLKTIHLAHQEFAELLPIKVEA